MNKLEELKRRFEGIHSSDPQPYPWMVRHDQYRDLCRDLFALAEAYREVALDWKNSLDPISLLSDSHIDEQAEKIFQSHPTEEKEKGK